MAHPPDVKSEKESTLAEKRLFLRASSTAITKKPSSDEKIDPDQPFKLLESQMLEGVHGLPERLATKLGTIDPAPFLLRAEELRTAIEDEKNLEARALLQQQLIFQYISIISRVQNGGDKGFTPAVAEDVQGLDCSLSAWCLKEKLQDVPGLECKFGNPIRHVVNIITLADGRTMYVDAQNGFMSAIEWKEVKDDQFPETAYPIYEVDETKTERISGNLPDGSTTLMTRSDGCDYTPQHFGVSDDGLLLTLGNLHMFLLPTAPTFPTETAKLFRKELGIPLPSRGLESAFQEACPKAYARSQTEPTCDDDAEIFFREELQRNHPTFGQEADQYSRICHEKWEEYNQVIMPSLGGGNTIYDTKFDELATAHHDKWKAEEVRKGLLNK